MYIAHGQIERERRLRRQIHVNFRIKDNSTRYRSPDLQDVAPEFAVQPRASTGNHIPGDHTALNVSYAVN